MGTWERVMWREFHNHFFSFRVSLFFHFVCFPRHSTLIHLDTTRGEELSRHRFPSSRNNARHLFMFRHRRDVSKRRKHIQVYPIFERERKSKLPERFSFPLQLATRRERKISCKLIFNIALKCSRIRFIPPIIISDTKNFMFELRICRNYLDWINFLFYIFLYK